MVMFTLKKNKYKINYFITDHLGSTRVIIDANGTVKGQYNYYPFGKQWEDINLMANTNRYTFSGKEKQTVNDLGWLDFMARMYANSEIPRFTTQDPLSEKYYSWSPYAYCAGNPISRIDPDGREWKDTQDEKIAKQLQQQATNRDNSLAKQEAKINSKIEKIENNAKLSAEKKTQQIAKQQVKLENVQAQRTILSNFSEGITQLGNSKTVYTFNTVEQGTTATLSSTADGTVVINNYGTVGNRAHETTHAIQYDNGKMSFNPLGSNNIKYNNSHPAGLEINAYEVEYSITGGTVPTSDARYPRTVFGINLQWLYGLKDPNTGGYPYRPENYR
jgi:RHS repeat-associated protein